MSLDRTPLDDAEILLDGISVPPALNNLFANGRNGGRFITASYKVWRQAAGFEVLTQRPQRVRGPVDITLTVQDGASKADIDGLLKAPIDLLVEMRLIDGDGPKVVRSVKAAYGACQGLRIEVRRARVAAEAA